MSILEISIIDPLTDAFDGVRVFLGYLNFFKKILMVGWGLSETQSKERGQTYKKNHALGPHKTSNYK